MIHGLRAVALYRTILCFIRSARSNPDAFFIIRIGLIVSPAYIRAFLSHTIGTTYKEGKSVKKTFNVFSVIALVLTIIGALNWLSVGIFGFNFVTWISFGMMWLERLIYILVGVSGVFMFVWLCVSRGQMVEQDTATRNYKYAEHRTTLRNE